MAAKRRDGDALVLTRRCESRRDVQRAGAARMVVVVVVYRSEDCVSWWAVNKSWALDGVERAQGSRRTVSGGSQLVPD